MEVMIDKYLKSINESGLPEKYINVIWDFYVTKAIDGSSKQKRKITDYNYNNIPFNEMLKIAHIKEDNYKILLTDYMNNNLDQLNLKTTKKIDIDNVRFIYLCPYKVLENGDIKPKTSRAQSLLNHIRNALSHGNTYFFDNGNILLEDKNKKKTTAVILIKVTTLLDWIKLIDKDKIFYDIDDITENKTA